MFPKINPARQGLKSMALKSMILDVGFISYLYIPACVFDFDFSGFSG